MKRTASRPRGFRALILCVCIQYVYSYSTYIYIHIIYNMYIQYVYSCNSTEP